MSSSLPNNQSKTPLFKLDNEEKKDYGSAAAYVQEVNKWSQSFLNCIAYQQMISTFWTNSFLQQQQAVMFMQQQQALSQLAPRRTTIRLNLTRIFRAAGTPLIPQTIIIQQFELPSLLRRIAAESIDAIILFIFKLLLVFSLVEADLMEIEQFENILSAHADLQTLIDVTQGLFSVELVYKLIAAFIEALCLTYGIGHIPNGCTPGKWLFGIRVISCLDVQPVVGSPERVAITSLSFIDFKRALLRSVLKNSLTTFLFPLSTAFYIFNYNRAVYDLIAKTIVVKI